MRKLFRKAHLWLSVPFGLIISIVCFSGAMLVFEKEIMEIIDREMYFTDGYSGGQAAGFAVSVDQAARIVSESLPDEVMVTGVTVFSDPQRAWQVNLSKPKRAAVYVDQYTGEIKGRYERSGFFSVMFRMHRWLLDSMKPGETVFWGKIMVGASTLMFVFVLVSGIVIWWPRTFKALKMRLKISVGKGWKRFWYDLHVTGGMYVVVFLLAMALTGLTWSFKWYRTGFYRVFGVEMTQNPGHGGKSGHPGDTGDGSGRSGAETLSVQDIWHDVYGQLAESNPDFSMITVSDGSASVSFDRAGNSRAADRYSFDRSDGQITGVSLYRDSEKTAKIRGWIYSVHVGNWGGLLTRILSFVAAMVGATLPLTGYWLWLKRILK